MRAARAVPRRNLLPAVLETVGVRVGAGMPRTPLVAPRIVNIVQVNRHQIVTVVTLAIAALWGLTVMIRFWQQDHTANPLDPLVTVAISGWYASNARSTGAST